MMNKITNIPPLRLMLFAKVPTFICKVCSAFHGGLYSSQICHECWKKGER